MAYTLITAKGRIQQFYVAEVASLYLALYGGVIITESVMETVDACTV